MYAYTVVYVFAYVVVSDVAKVPISAAEVHMAVALVSIKVGELLFVKVIIIVLIINNIVKIVVVVVVDIGVTFVVVVDGIV